MISLQVKDFLSDKACRLVRSRSASGTYLVAAIGLATLDFFETFFFARIFRWRDHSVIIILFLTNLGYL